MLPSMATIPFHIPKSDIWVAAALLPYQSYTFLELNTLDFYQQDRPVKYVSCV